MQTATEAFKTFKTMPAPQRGEIVRQFGEKLRKIKHSVN
jgi:aldehyde dehydrogenase (NAD+)